VIQNTFCRNKRKNI